MLGKVNTANDIARMIADEDNTKEFSDQRI